MIIDAATGEVLHQENADAPRKPASLTKMMTLYLTFQALDNNRLRLDSMLPVSSLAAGQSPTKLGLRAGQRVAVEDLILGLVTESANDAAIVLAEALGGDVDSFAAKMTQTAHRLGMQSTTYQNPNGLPDPGQVTTARDQARLALALQRHYPRYYHYFSTPTFAYGGRMHPNHNRLMARYEGMDGIKTGFIRESGFNLVASCKRGNKRLIGVIFGGPSAAGRDNELAALLDAAFARANGGGDSFPRTQAASYNAEPPPPVMQASAAASAMQAEPYTPAASNETTRDVAVANTHEVTSADRDIVAAVNSQAQPVMQPAMQAAPQPTPALAEQAPTQQAPTVRTASASGTLQLPSAATTPRVESQSTVKTAAPVQRNEPQRSDPQRTGGNWGIQIGAYNDRASGQRATAMIADSMPDILQNAAPRVLSVATGTGTIYRARLVGLDEKSARAACTRLQAKSRPCMTLPPSGGANSWLASADN